MLLAAAPHWLSENMLPIGVVALLVLCLLALGLLHGLVVKVMALLLLSTVGSIVYINRDEVQTCGHLCKCHIFVDLEVPWCKPDPDF